MDSFAISSHLSASPFDSLIFGMHTFSISFFFLLQALLEIRKINGFLFSGKLEVDICFVDMFDQIWTTPCILPKLELD